MSTDSVVRARIDSDTKVRATAALDAMGFSSFEGSMELRGRLTTAGEADKWRETVALEHKRNAELQSDRDALADRLSVLEAEKNEQKNG
jgi:hypothetical protein